MNLSIKYIQVTNITINSRARKITTKLLRIINLRVEYMYISFREMFAIWLLAEEEEEDKVVENHHNSSEIGCYTFHATKHF